MVYLYSEKSKARKDFSFMDDLEENPSFFSRVQNYINKQNIKYLIVDEFQDISSLRAEVIKKIQKE